MLGLLGSVASGVLNLFGQSKAQKNANQADERNIALQKQFAQEGVQWRVKDAVKAGIHPLAALGANTMSFSPVTAGASVPQKDFSFLRDMGQDIDRARMATAGSASRGVARIMEGLTLERSSLENDLLRSQIRRSNMVGPAMPGLIPEQVVDPQRTTGVNFGVPIRSNPNFSDAQSNEDRYGELGGSILGLANIPADLYWAVKPYLDRALNADYSTHRGPPNRGFPRFGGGR